MKRTSNTSSVTNSSKQDVLKCVRLSFIVLNQLTFSFQACACLMSFRELRSSDARVISFRKVFAPAVQQITLLILQNQQAQNRTFSATKNSDEK